ncbi:hypothetical protein [Myxococcus qinghaiensis]|uniref:hypothetical protein n=1 Tax=Myxococcus qinghaiensis TaxID=2906758 RepID=UPI0020A7CE44|nr:hypothetical protein [Myxococcus qinghaiensis]
MDVVTCFGCRQLMFLDAKNNLIADAGFLDGFPVMQDIAKSTFPEGGFNQGW